MCKQYGGAFMKFKFGQKFIERLKVFVNFIQTHTRYVSYNQMFKAYKINRLLFKVLIFLLIGGILFIPPYYVMLYLMLFVVYDYICYQKSRKLRGTAKVAKKLLKQYGYSCDYWTLFDGSSNSVEIVFCPTGTLIEDLLRRLFKRKKQSATVIDEFDSLVTYMNRCEDIVFNITCTLEEYHQLEKYGLLFIQSSKLSNVPDKICYKSYRPKGKKVDYPRFIRCSYQVRV